MWSMPLPSVKKRSNRPVMSFSICSGGMPEKNVATTTTGIFTSGNRSTGMRLSVVPPMTQTIRQSTMTKYGNRIEKRDITKDGTSLGAGRREKGTHGFTGEGGRIAQLHEALLPRVQEARDVGQCRRYLPGDAQQAVAVAVQQLAGGDAQTDDLYRSAGLHHMDIGMGRRDAGGEERQPTTLDLRQGADGAIGNYTHTAQRLEDGRMRFADKRAHPGMA